MTANATKAHLEFNKKITPIVRKRVTYDHKYSHSYPNRNTTKFDRAYAKHDWPGAPIDQKLLNDLTNELSWFPEFVGIKVQNHALYVYSDAKREVVQSVSVPIARYQQLLDIERNYLIVKLTLRQLSATN